MKKGTIPQNCTYLVQRISQIGALDNIDLKDNWFTPDIDEDPSKNPSHEPIVTQENVNNKLVLLQYVLYLQEGPVSEGASVFEVIERPASKVFQNTSNSKKFSFAQQSFNVPSGMPSREGEKESKMPNMIDIASTGPRISARLSTKTKQKYGLFDQLSLSVIGAFEVAKNPHMFLTG